MTSLLDPRDGIAAQDVRAAVGLDPATRMAELEARCARLERTLTTVMRVFRGFAIEGNDAYVTPEQDTGWIRIHSLDSSVTITDEPIGGAHNVNIEVAAPGCTAAYDTRCHNDGQTITIDACSSDDGIVGETSARGVARLYTYGLSSGPPVTGGEIIVTPTATGEGWTVSHLLSFVGDDGKLYTVQADQGNAAGSPVFACG